MDVRHCYFCQKFSTYSPLEEMENRGIKIFYCYPCQAEYLYFTEYSANRGSLREKPSSYALYKEINGKMYRWNFFYVNEEKVGQLWLIRKPGIPGQSVNQELELIDIFREIKVEVTPQNIENKIKSWLPFL